MSTFLLLFSTLLLPAELRSISSYSYQGRLIPGLVQVPTENSTLERELLDESLSARIIYKAVTSDLKGEEDGSEQVASCQSLPTTPDRTEKLERESGKRKTCVETMDQIILLKTSQPIASPWKSNKINTLTSLSLQSVFSPSLFFSISFLVFLLTS